MLTNVLLHQFVKQLLDPFVLLASRSGSKVPSVHETWAGDNSNNSVGYLEFLSSKKEWVIIPLLSSLSTYRDGAAPLHFAHTAGTLHPFLVCLYFLPGYCAESSQGKGKEVNDEECHCSSKYIGCCGTAACASHTESAFPIFVFIFLLLFSTYISLRMKWTKLHARCITTFKIRVYYI